MIVSPVVQEIGHVGRRREREADRHASGQHETRTVLSRKHSKCTAPRAGRETASGGGVAPRWINLDDGFNRYHRKARLDNSTGFGQAAAFAVIALR